MKEELKIRASLEKNNQRFAKIRSVVELPFAFIKHHINFRVAKYIGIAKNQEHFSLIATCYNLRRNACFDEKIEQNIDKNSPIL